MTEVYDIETYKETFTYVGYDIKTLKLSKFIIHKDLNQIIDFYKHLDQLKGMIGFNNIAFDYPIIHYILESRASFNLISAEDIITLIYNKAQKLISSQSIGEYNFGIKSKDIKIPQMDLFRMWHFNNAARSTSLKSLEISMNYPNVMEMPIHHSKENLTLDEVHQIVDYNVNDVMATYEFYKLSKGKIELRKGLDKQYNLNCINFSDSKIGEELMLNLYSQKTNQDKWEIKKLRTKRESIKLKDCIFDYIKFNSKEFNNLLDKLNSKTITETKGSITESVIYKGFKYDYGTGGIHGCIKAGIYESDDDYIIIDADVASLYPSIAVTNKLYPEHLGIEFCDIYEDILKQRIAAKKAGNMVMSDGYKLSLNSVYGKSNDEHSFLMDPLYTMKTTLNGQLMISMLCESLVDKIKDLTMLQVNTDGLTVKIPKSQHSINTYYNICNDWELKTKLTLEYVEYSKMIIRDVNNYTAVSTKGKIKHKGAFELDKELHKDNSFRIIPLALQEFFVNNTPIEQTIKNHKNIYDFCGRQKFKGQDYAEAHYIEYNKDNNPIAIVDKLQKNIRYFISNKGKTLIKQYAKGSKEFIHKGYYVTIFNNYELKDNYNINYQWYINETQKEINNIIDNQLELF